MTDTSPRLEHTTRGDTVLYNGKFLYSRHDPKKNPERIASSVTIPDKTLVIVPSPLLFHGVGKLLTRLSSDCHILCVEIDQSLMSFSINQGQRSIIEDDNLSTIRTANPKALIDFIDTLRIDRFRRVLPLFLSGGYALNKAAYDNLIRAADRHIQRHWQNRITLVHMSRMWLKNIVSNLVRGWTHLEHRLPESQKPVVVAGAGESLEKALENLYRYRDHFYLIAVDTALPVLSTRKIHPDAVVVLEGQLVNSAAFFGHNNREFTLLCDLSAHPSTLDAINGKKHFFLTQFASTRFLERLVSSGLGLQTMRPMGSVGVAAVDMARSITPHSIILTGLDFCYVPGKPHSRGAPSHIRSLSSSIRTKPVGLYAECMGRPLIETKNRRGERIITDLVLRSYGDDLDEALQAEERVYDIRNGGLPLSSIDVDNDEGFLEAIMPGKENGGKKATGNSGTTSHVSRNTKERVAGFVEEEQRLLGEFLAVYQSKRPKSSSEPADPQLIAALNEVDYITLSFADSHETDTATGQFMVRAAASATDLYEFMGNAIAMLE